MSEIRSKRTTEAYRANMQRIIDRKREQDQLSNLHPIDYREAVMKNPERVRALENDGPEFCDGTAAEGFTDGHVINEQHAEQAEAMVDNDADDT